MTPDEALAAVLAEQVQNPQCKTCRLVAGGRVTDEWIATNLNRHQVKVTAAALRRAYGDDAPSDDALRNHVQRHVA